jgi:methyl acetate hydrolase
VDIMNGAGAILADTCTAEGAPGIVASAGTADGASRIWTCGFSDLARAEPMAPHDIFRVTSMAKLVTSVAVLQLVDRDQLDLDDAVSRLLPQFGLLQVLTGFDGDQPVLRAPARDATVRELLAHTSGLAYSTWNPLMLRYEQVTGVPNISTGRLAALEQPLVADPGTEIGYGAGMDWAGLIVEKLSGQPLDLYCQRNIFGPLQMRDTSMRRPEERGLSLVPALRAGAARSWETATWEFPLTPEFYFGGGCVYSTAGDYLRLQLTLLGDGALGGTRILTADAVDAMFAPQTSGLEIPPMRTAVPEDTGDVDLGPGWSWGFGMTVNSRPLPTGRSAGSGAWSGIFNTSFWIDRHKGVAGNLFMQFLPFRTATALRAAEDFETAVYDGL